MKSDKPTMAAPMLLFILAAACYAIGNHETVAPSWRIVLTVTMVVFVVFGAFAAGDLVSYKLAWRKYEWNLADSQSREVQWVNAISRLNEAQLAYVKSVGSLETIIAADSSYKPVELVRLRNGSGGFDEIPRGAFDPFTDWNNGYLPSVRDSGGEGTQSREHTRIITQWLIVAGLAEPAAGNQPARWKSEQAYRKAMTALGYKL